MDALGLSRLKESANAEEVMQRLEDLASPYRAHITSIRLFCNERDRDSVLCSLNATTNAPAIATAIGGIVFGFSLVCRGIDPVRGDFRCPNRHNGMLRMPSCNKCGREYSLKRADPGEGAPPQPPDRCHVAPQPDRGFAHEHVDDAR